MEKISEALGRSLTKSATAPPEPSLPAGHWLRTANDQALASLIPATGKEIAVCLEKCARLCGGYPTDFSPTLWTSGLVDIPADLLAAAVDRYLFEPSRDRRWFPQPGQLRAYIADDLARRRADLAQAKQVIRQIEQRADYERERDNQATAADVEAIVKKYYPDGMPGLGAPPAARPLYVADCPPATINGGDWRKGEVRPWETAQ